MADRFADLLNRVTNNKIEEGDEETLANNPRNALADFANPLLDKYVNPVLPDSMQAQIPKMTVADDKNFYANLPEQMAGATMGGVQTIASPKGLGKILNIVGDEAQNLGKVTMKPSMADLADDVAKSSTAQPAAKSIMQKFDDMFGAEASARKAKMQKGEITPDAYSSWKQEMYNKLRGQ